MSNCIQSINHSQIKCEEKQSKFILLNPQRKMVDYITVDSCIYPCGHHGLCCDYALNFDNRTLFLELKGSDIAHAIKQILATEQDAKFTINTNKTAIIITSKTPKNDLSLQNQKVKLKKRHINLIQRNSRFEKDIAEF
ncbi:MAG: hypothetical protein E6Q33_07740 [Neisseriales bacterium]|nr:MAG: hypothetical protein E6Q33_07740 [Neisseriales bacterium]